MSPAAACVGPNADAGRAGGCRGELVGSVGPGAADFRAVTQCGLRQRGPGPSSANSSRASGAPTAVPGVPSSPSVSPSAAPGTTASPSWAPTVPTPRVPSGAPANATAAPTAAPSVSPATASPTSPSAPPTVAPSEPAVCGVCGSSEPLLAAASCPVRPSCVACSGGTQKLLPSCNDTALTISANDSLVCFGDACRGSRLSCPDGNCAVVCAGIDACKAVSLSCPPLLAAGGYCRIECIYNAACGDVGAENVTGDASAVCQTDKYVDPCSPFLLGLAAGGSSDGGGGLPSWTAAVIGVGGMVCCTVVAAVWWYLRGRQEVAGDRSRRGSEVETAKRKSPETLPLAAGVGRSLSTPTDEHPPALLPPPPPPPPPAPPSRQPTSELGTPLAPGASVQIPAEASLVRGAVQAHPSLQWNDGYLRGLGVQGEVVREDLTDDTVLVRFSDPPAEAWYPSTLFQPGLLRQRSVPTPRAQAAAQGSAQGVSSGRGRRNTMQRARRHTSLGGPGRGGVVWGNTAFESTPPTRSQPRSVARRWPGPQPGSLDAGENGIGLRALSSTTPLFSGAG